MIKFKQKGNFENLDKYFHKSSEIVKVKDIEPIARKCVQKLIEVTPKDSGLTAESWNYLIVRNDEGVTIQINNTNIQNGINVALLIEYGHGTRNGSWIEGKNYIAPTVLSAYLEVMNSTWEELKRL